MFRFWKKKARPEAGFTITREELREVLAEALEGQRQKLAREFEVRAREQVSALLDPVREILESMGEAQANALSGIGELRAELRDVAQRLEGRVVAVETQTARSGAALERLEDGAETIGTELACQAQRLERAEETLREAQRLGEERLAELTRAHDAELARAATEREKEELQRAYLEDQIGEASRELASISASVSASSRVALRPERDEATSDGRLTRRALQLLARPWNAARQRLGVRRRALELQRSFAQHEARLVSLRQRLGALSPSGPEPVALARANGSASAHRLAPAPRARTLAGALGPSGIAARPSEATS